MQNVGQQQLLVLLFVMDSELGQRRRVTEAIARRSDQLHYRDVNGHPVPQDFLDRRPRQKSSLRSRMAWSHRLII
jgi:hypothetical protein